MTAAARPRVVIVGAGFGGLFAAQALERAPVDVTVVDRHNYHLFQPLLYQVATAGLPPSDVAWPIRSILHRQRNATVLLGEVTGVDRERRVVLLAGRELPFDYLVLATGSTHSYFGHDDWQPYAPGLKSIDDATNIRGRVLRAFEAAEMSTDAAERARLLTFAIVGAGPTGVELAGTIAELARFTLAADFRRIDPRGARIVLIEAGPRVLAAFAPPQSDYAARALAKLGVDVRTNARVTSCDAAGVVLGAERLSCGTVIWAAGVTSSPAAKWLGAAADRAGRAVVAADLTVAGDDRIFVIGDAAAVALPNGKLVPGVAPAAKQQGRFAASVIAARVAGAAPPPAFVYRDPGNLATIGRSRAVIEFPRITLRGWLAWWIWGVAHIFFLVGVPSPIIVSLRWLWEYVTYGRGARLITGSTHAD